MARRTLLVALALVASACTGSSGTTTTAVATTTPSTSTTTATTPTTTTAGATTTSTAAATPADTIYVGGTVLTMVPARPRAEAVAVAGEVIIAVGTEAAIRSFEGDNTTVVDLDGRTLMPGFVDAHTHLLNDAASLGTDLAGAQQIALENGITTLGNLYTTEDFLAEMRSFDDADELIVGTSLYLAATDPCGLSQGDWWKAQEPTRISGERLRIGGIKVFADGGVCGKLAGSDELLPGYGLGDLWHTQDAMDGFFAEATARGHQLAVHAQGDRAVEQVLASLATVVDDGANELRHRIEHNAIVPPELRPRYTELDAVATVFGWTDVCGDTPWTPFWQDLGEDWRSLLDANAGGHFAWHGDDPWVGPVSPLLELASLVTRQEVTGDGTACEPPDWMADNAITVDEGLALMTTGSAYALFRETEVGSIEPGKYADFVVLSEDPTAGPPAAVWDITVLATIVGDEVVFCVEVLCDEPDGDAGEVSVYASRESGGSTAAAAFDGVTDATGWVSGSGPVQWIEIDLGTESLLEGVVLWVDQFPSGRTVHHILGGPDPEPTDVLAIVEGETTWGDAVAVDGPWTVRYLRIETVESPSWVAWLEIELLTAGE